MTDEGTAVAVYRRYNEAENARDRETMGALLDPALAVEMNGAPALGSSAEDDAAMAALFVAYPDYRREVVAVVDGGQEAAIRWRMRGTPRPDLADRLPVIDVHGCSVVHVRDGRMTAAWLYADAEAMRSLLALAAMVPPPEA